MTKVIEKFDETGKLIERITEFGEPQHPEPSVNPFAPYWPWSEPGHTGDYPLYPTITSC
jgi:hypothetical protein